MSDHEDFHVILQGDSIQGNEGLAFPTDLPANQTFNVTNNYYDTIRARNNNLWNSRLPDIESQFRYLREQMNERIPSEQKLSHHASDIEQKIEDICDHQNAIFKEQFKYFKDVSFEQKMEEKNGNGKKFQRQPTVLSSASPPPPPLASQLPQAQRTGNDLIIGNSSIQMQSSDKMQSPSHNTLELQMQMEAENNGASAMMNPRINSNTNVQSNSDNKTANNNNNNNNNANNGNGTNNPKNWSQFSNTKDLKYQEFWRQTISSFYELMSGGVCLSLLVFCLFFFCVVFETIYCWKKKKVQMYIEKEKLLVFDQQKTHLFSRSKFNFHNTWLYKPLSVI
ncbi:involucrin repeat-containing protein [Reticulomyxa filosa]|uniref:Involucrin repeat-containing protein n=1 Tax=Reticulomyxa filosa TaxID=46433 RepID=X6MCR0_RETFI|nr:involucrin repeat-containing protein [Reticulomyxa filosa]|eukprot:ETO11426.1 involucrin repeat-containing protein [Reticulomyxa filosa]